MPLYDYTCQAGHKFDRFVKMSDYQSAQRCECGEGAERRLSAPRILSDYIEPCRGADGKMHDSLSSLRKTYLPEGNPKGERFIEVGNETVTSKPVEFDKKQRRDDIRAALEDVKNGRVPPIPPGPGSEP